MIDVVEDVHAGVLSNREENRGLIVRKGNKDKDVLGQTTTYSFNADEDKD